MTLNIAVPKETKVNERRVAATPETVSLMVKNNMAVFIETHAGMNSYIHDEDYTNAGAKISKDNEELFRNANIILKVNTPSLDETKLFPEKSALIAPLFPSRHLELMKALNSKKMTSFSLDLLPRIARSQSMDILSSMSNLAGYKSVILAAQHVSRIFPMMTTAAGTILPAKVIVIGAGVAGLQAIATARRLGAVVIGFDTRPVTSEQVKSLGAEFVSLETTHEQSEDQGGYAKEQTAEFYKKEQDIIQQYLKQADVVITTALIPGKSAPILITADMVKSMKPGSVIVDLAAEQGGNCALCEANNIIVKDEVTIIGLLNLPSTLAVNASQMFAKNVYTFLKYIAPNLETGQFDHDDEIIKACLIMQNGEMVHSMFRKTIQEGS